MTTSSSRVRYLTGVRDHLARISDEAQSAGLAAEDALGGLEDREARRAARGGGR